jgi:hypothetical protein
VSRRLPRGVYLPVVDDEEEAVGCSDFNACFTCGASGSVGASLRNCLYAAIATALSPADCAAWPSWIWIVASLGVSAASFW